MAHAELHDLHAYATSRMPLDLAREMAQSEDGEILLISGAIPMDIGYPDDEQEGEDELQADTHGRLLSLRSIAGGKCAGYMASTED